MQNKLPPATAEFHPTETVDLAAVRPLAARALALHVQRGGMQTVRAGSKGFATVKAPDVVTGPDGEHEVYWNGDVRDCTCGKLRCLHLAAVEATEMGL